MFHKALRHILLGQVSFFTGFVFLLFVAVSAGSVIATFGAFPNFSVEDPTQVARASKVEAFGQVLGLSSPEVVRWTNLVKVITEDGDLEQISSGCQGCSDAGARSEQQIISGDGFFEFTVPTGPFNYTVVGLSNDLSSATSSIMPFALELNGQYTSVREQGAYKGEIQMATGDVFRISLEAGKVKYYKNGNLFYTSQTTPVYPLVADVGMQSMGSKVWSGKIAVESTVVVVSPPPTITPPATTTTTTTTTTVANVKPVGYLDGVSSQKKTVFGWAKDANTNDPIKVHLYFDSRVGSRNAQPVEVLANVFRTDVGAYGFDFPIPAKYLDGRKHSVRAYAIDPNDATGKSNVLLSGSPKYFTLKSSTVTPPPAPVNTAPRGNFDGVNLSAGTVFGWAEDPDNLSASVDVHLYFDKNAGTSGATPVACKADKPRSDLTTGNHAFDCPIPSIYKDGAQHQVWAWAIDLAGGANTQLPGSPKVFVLNSGTVAPAVSSFTASPSTITVGQSSTLSWSGSGATSLSISPGVGTVTGTSSATVSPTATTTYTLTATNSVGSVTSSVTVTVNPVTPPPVTVPTSSVVELPRAYVNSGYPTLPSSSVARSVKASCGTTQNCYTNFQSALNAAVPGDEIVIDAGLTVIAPSGGFVLPTKSNPNNYWTIIRTSNMSGIPSAGNRVTPVYASAMPKIVTSDNLPAISTANGASYYRFVGVEITAASNVTVNSGLVLLGSSSETNAANQAHHIVFDRVYVHGNSNGENRRGFFLNSGETAIVDSYVSNILSSGYDSQAVLGINGPGPWKIVNNYLEATGENLMFGGGDPRIQNVVPADVEIRGNYFYKPLSWRNTSLVIKNLLELKIGKRILIAENIFENSWAAAQSGMALNIKTVNQDNTAPWSITEHITITNNIIRHAANGITLVDRDNNGPSGSTNNVYVANNLFDDISASRWGNGYGGHFLISLGATNNVTFSHNTAINDGNTINADGSPAQNFVFKDNISFLNAYGIKGSGFASGNDSIANFFPGSTFAKNVMVGSGSGYPTNNFYPASATAVGFNNYNNGSDGDYRLASSSSYNNAATDGADIGANIDTIISLTGCVSSGNCGTSSPPPSTPPAATLPVTTSFTASPSTITVGQSSTLSWSGSGATSLSISPGVGTVTGTSSATVSPTATTTYTLTATNSVGSVTSSVTVTVNPVTPPPSSATITVSASQRYQSINGWEAVAQAGQLLESSTRTNTSNLDPNFAGYKNTLFDQAVNDLGLNRLRIELMSGSEHSTDYFTQYLNGQLTFNEWRAKWYDPINDNTSPTSANAGGFNFSYLDFQMDQVVLPIKQRLEARGEQLFLNMCFVDFAGTSFEHYLNAEEYAELIVEAYKHLQSKYGFVPNTLEIALEPDNTSFNGTYMGQAMQATAARLATAGFTPRFIMPSTTSMSSANSYFDAAKAVVGDSFISQYVEEIAYHRYTGVSTSALQGIASRASQHGVKTGMLEWIGADYNTLHEDLKVGNVSGWEQYALAFPGGFDDGSIYYSVSGTSVNIGSRTKYLRQYFKHVRRGAVRIGASSANTSLDPIAFENTNGKSVVVVKAGSASSFSIAGLPAGTYGVMHTVNGVTTNASDVVLGNASNLNVSIPGAGVITVYAK